MADDQKRTDGGEDPWAGLDADPSIGADDAFEIPSFEQLEGNGTAGAASKPGEPVTASPSVPEFDPFALGADDGVFADDFGLMQPGGQGGGEAPPSPDGDPPLAVFPPIDSGEGGEGEAADDLDDAEALAHLEQFDALDEAVEAEPADRPATAEGSPEDPLLAAANPPADAIAFDVGEDADRSEGSSLIGRSTVEVGVGHSGIVPFDDWDASPDTTTVGDAFDGGDGGLDIDGVTGAGVPEGFEVGAAAAIAPAAAPKVSKKSVKRRSNGGGGLMAGIAVVLGGLMSIPIVFAVLFWVFRKDPLHIAPKIPQSLSFLLPAEFQIGGRPGPLPGLEKAPRMAAARPVEPAAADAPASLDVADESSPDVAGGDAPDASSEAPLDLSAESPTKPVEPAPAAAPVPSAASDADLFTDRPAPPVAEVKPPLDTAAFDEAVGASLEATERLLASDEQDPDRKAVLRSWYLSLAKVGEEAAVVERVAADSGREFDPASEGVVRVIGGILADEGAAEQFEKVSRMWIRSPKRTSDGVILPATMGGSRRVGPWWLSKIRLGEGEGSAEVSMISRTEPTVSEGDRVVVIGVVFEPGTIWAADCRRFEPKPLEDEAEPVAPAGRDSGDLFPLE